MNKTKMRASHNDHNGDTWTVEWHGGEYAEISTPSGKAVEVLNFWDYAEGAPHKDAPKNANDLRIRLREWLNESASWLHNYLY